MDTGAFDKRALHGFIAGLQLVAGLSVRPVFYTICMRRAVKGGGGGGGEALVKQYVFPLTLTRPRVSIPLPIQGLYFLRPAARRHRGRAGRALLAGTSGH